METNPGKEETAENQKEVIVEVHEQAEDKERAERKQKKEDSPIKKESKKDIIKSQKKQIEELKDKYLRLFADFDNHKKRVAKERLELIQTAGKEVIIDLLPVLDDFDRAIKASESTNDGTAALEGMVLIRTKLQNLLHEKGLREMESIGTEFDSELHEAITEIEAPKDNLKGKVVDEIEKGYYLNEKIIRFAKVVVGK